MEVLYTGAMHSAQTFSNCIFSTFYNRVDIYTEVLLCNIFKYMNDRNHTFRFKQDTLHSLNMDDNTHFL